MSQESPLLIARQLAAPPAEAAQFDFLIGDWSVEGDRYDAAGAIALSYRARWRAKYLHDRRIVLDDFTFLSPSGEELSAFVTLRTYAPAARRWQFAGLAAGEPGFDGRWSGGAVGPEMQQDAQIRTPDGATLRARERFFDIAADAFRWENHISRDGGANWALTSALIAHRAG